MLLCRYRLYDSGQRNKQSESVNRDCRRLLWPGRALQETNHNTSQLLPRLRMTPLAPPALGLCVGIVADAAFQPAWIAYAVAGPAVLVFVVAAMRYTHRGTTSARFRAFTASCFLLSIIAGGVHHAQASRGITGPHIRQYTDNHSTITTIEGTVASRPRIAEQNDRRRVPYPLPPKTAFSLKQLKVQTSNGPQSVDGRITVSVKEPMLFLQAGERVRIVGRLYAPLPPANPGGFDWARHLHRQGIDAALSTDHAAAVEVIARDSNTFTQALNSYRTWADHLLHQDSELIENNDHGAVSAMVLGQRSQVDRDLNEAFVRTGGAHFLAASGMHVAWLALMGWWLTRFIGTHYRASAVVIAIMIVAYVALAEPRPSILRAGVMGLLACVSIYRRGHIHTTNWLAAWTIILVLINPYDIFNVALQLSFVAVLAIVYLVPPVERALAQRVPFLRGRYESEPYTDSTVNLPLSDAVPSNRRLLLDAIIKAFRITLAASIAVWIANLPLVTYHFDRFAPWGWLFNLLLIVPAFLLTIFGFLKVILVALLPSSSPLIAPIVDVISQLFTGWVRILASLPGTLCNGNQPSLVWVAACYITLTLVIWRPRTFRRRWSLAALTIALIVWWQIPHRWFVADRGALNVWALAVGDGTGTVIELPDGRVMLFDCGTRTPLDASNVAINFLRERGIRRIDTVFVSHANWDHYGALEYIAAEIPFDRIVLSAQFDRFAAENSGGWHFKEAIKARQIPIATASSDDEWTDASGVHIDVIWPPPEDARPAPSANDGSLAIALTFENQRVIVTGDQAEWGLGGMIAEADLACDALILPHHGSVVHNTKAFIDAANARINVRSSGQRRDMTTNNIDQIVGPDRGYHNTADDGCVRIRATAEGVTATTQYGR